MLRRTRLVSACLLFLVGAIRLVWGQGSVGTLTGTVLDAAGAVVPGAVVVITNTQTGIETKTTTTDAGAFTAPYLPAGTYKIAVTAPGFRTATLENVILRVAQNLSVNVHLEVGQVNEQVTVSDTPPLLETGTAEIGRYISTEEFKSWPIFIDDGQRQLQTFIFTSLPGAVGGGFQGSINGGQFYSHEILIEGIPVGRSDISGGNMSEFTPSAEGVNEFKLQTGAIGAQYNGGQTAVANFAIKSGTNDLHGSGFLYLGNEAFNAWSLGAKTTKKPGQKKPKNRENNEGFSLGGPVYIPKLYDGRGKSFFFVDFERDHYNRLGFNGFSTVAYPDFYKGDFSKLLDPAFTGNPKSGTQIGTDALNRPIIFGQIYDPLTTRKAPDGSTIRDPFVGNIIPTNRFNAVSKNILDIGLPKATYDRMINNVDRVSNCCPLFDLRVWGVKGDHNFSDKHHLSGYFNHTYRLRQNNAGGSNGRYLPVPGPVTSTWKDQYTPGRMVRLALNSTLKPTVLNRVAAGFNRFFNSNGARQDTINKGWAEKIGIQNTSPAGFPRFTFGRGFQYQGSGIAQIGAGEVFPGANGSWVFTDDLTWLKGKHSARFGYSYTRYYYNERNPQGSGSFSFDPQQTDFPGQLASTGHAFASFLLGAPRSASRGVNPLSSGFRQPYHAFYAMDDIKVSSKLTVNAGLRWEIVPPFFERTGRMSYIDLGVPNPEAANRPGALVFGKSPSTTYWKLFGPRLGFAYQVSQKMVVRAGYAMTNTPPIRNDWGYSGFTYGYNASINVRAGTSPTGFVDDPAMYLNQRFPDFKGTLPDTNPSVGNFDASAYTAPDANRPGYTQNWNLTIQYVLPGETVLEAAYVGNKGTRMWGGSVGQEVNGLPASLLRMGDILNDLVVDHPEFIPYAGFPAEDFTVAQALKPFPQYTSVFEAFPYNTNSNYNALQLTATRHLTKGLGFLAAYTWSKTIAVNDAQGPAQYYASFQDYYNRKLDRSIAYFNYPQNLKLTWVWETPFGKGRKWDLGLANYALGGWQLAAIHNYRSGDPVAVFSSGLNSPTGFSGSIRPDVIPGQPLTLSSLPDHVDYFNPTPYLNPKAFAPVPTTPDGVPLRVGTAPRFINNLRGPRVVDEQFRLSKFFPIKERGRVGIGMTMTNPFNRTSKFFESTTVGDANFGFLAAGGGGRTLQLDARIEF